MEISDYQAAPYDGVSQAPSQVRLQSACEAMEDCIATIPFGIQKRPPFEWMAKLVRQDTGAVVPSDPFALWVDIPRGDPSLDLTLLIAREGTTPKAYLFQTATMAPVALTVASAAQTYLNLNSPTPHRDIRTCTVDDTTFITNRSVTVANVAGVAGRRPFEAIIWCKLSGYARTTGVSIASTAIPGGSYTAAFTTGTGSNTNDPLTVGTDKLAKALYDGTDPKVGNDIPNPNPLNALTAHGFTVTLLGSLIYISHATVDFSLGISDDIGGTGVVPIKSTVQRFSDLPALAVDGFTVRIAQQAAGGNSDYYVQFQASSSNNSGTWKEVIAPGAALGLDRSTMPISLRPVSGVWTLDVLPWVQRLTGDATLSPDPDFISDQITDIGWWRGRLVLLSNGQVNLSASDSPYKFYTSTLATALDSDPIGLLPPADLKVNFKAMKIFDARLLLMGDKGQAIVSSSSGVTPTDTLIQPLSNSPFDGLAPVQDVIHKVYFGANRGGFKVILELAIDRLSGLALPEEMTAAIPTFVPAIMDRAASFKTDYMTLYGNSGGSRLYLHTFRHSQQQQVQNGWSGWNLPPGWTLGGYYIKDSALFGIVYSPDTTPHAVTMQLAPNRPDPNGGTVRTYADMRVSDTQCTVTFDGTQTFFTLPIPVQETIVASVRAPASAAHHEGYRPTIIARNGTQIILKGDWRGVPLWMGYPYTSFFTPTRFYKRGQDGNPERAGRLTVQRLKVDVAAFSYLLVHVNITGRRPYTTTYSGDGVIGDVPLQRVATVTIPIGGNNEQTSVSFESADLFGFAIVGYEWEGSWSPRATRVT